MLDLLKDTWLDLHPIVCHSPIILLTLSVALSIVARWKSIKPQMSWVSLVLGVGAAVIASITGIIAHSPYRATEFYDVIQAHLLISLLATAIYGGLALWRWLARRHGAEVEATSLYLGIAVAGVLVLLLCGMTGGDLVFDYGIGVRGINPLLP